MTDVDVVSLPPMNPPGAVTSTSVNSGNNITSQATAGAVAAIGSQAGLRYYGFTVMETGGNPASFTIRTTGFTGPILDTITLNPGESTSDWYGPEGEDVAAGGIWVVWISGSFVLALRSKVVP